MNVNGILMQLTSFVCVWGVGKGVGGDSSVYICAHKHVDSCMAHNMHTYMSIYIFIPKWQYIDNS